MTPLYTLCRVIRKMDWTIGFANGCFDLLHDGHLHLLKTAKNHCDVLFVGVNDDKSVRAIKGNNRPAISLSKRIKTLEETGLCDGIFGFGSEEDLLGMIADIKPDFLVKGADYKGKEITGESFVKEHDGMILLVPLLPGVSTTKLLQY